MNTNPVAAALRIFFQPGDVFELRLLDAETNEYRRGHVESGYFDYDHIDAAAESVDAVRFYRGAYVTANPCIPALLARSSNRIKQAERGVSTTDNYIISRRWFLVDCDAVRPSGISSADPEHEAARVRAQTIKDYLSNRGWPLPLVCDSGNGAQLMYRIDLPADDGGLLKQCLDKLSKQFSDNAVNIDLTVFNPSRIWRLPGTWNRKGDDLPERPHRLAKLAEIPETLSVVERRLLDELAGCVINESHVGTIGANEVSTHAQPTVQPQSEPDITAIAGPPPPPKELFNLDDWIRQYCPDLGDAQPWQGGRKWVFDICPFNPEHTNRSAVITEQPGGAIGFKCHHNGCSGHNWAELRELKEGPKLVIRNVAVVSIPESGTRQPTIPVTGNPGAEPAPRKKLMDKFNHPDPGPLPNDLLAIPGFVHDVMQHTLSTAPYPNQVLAFTGALALLSYLCGRNIRDTMNNMPNLYLIALANSGTGKDHPRKINVEIAYRAGLAGGIGDAFASGEGIEDCMFLSQKMLFQTDEIDGLLNSINKARDGRNEMIMNVLLKMYSAANSIYPLRKRASLGNVKRKEENPVIDKPSLTLFGTAVPKYLYESLNGRMLDNGFFARSIILEAGDRGKGQNVEHQEIPDFIIDQAKKLAEEFYGAGEADSGNLFSEHPTPKTINATAAAGKILDGIRDHVDQEWQKQSKRGDETAMAIWARAYEKTRKLAMLYAVSANWAEPVIDEAAVNWAWKFVEYQTKRMLFMAESYVADNPFHAECLKAKRRIQAAGGKISHIRLLRLMHLKSNDFECVMKYMEEAGEIWVDYSTEDGKPGKVGKLYELAQ